MALNLSMALLSLEAVTLPLPTLIRPTGECAKDDVDIASADACGKGVSNIGIDVVRSWIVDRHRIDSASVALNR